MATASSSRVDALRRRVGGRARYDVNVALVVDQALAARVRRYAAEAADVAGRRCRIGRAGAQREQGGHGDAHAPAYRDAASLVVARVGRTAVGARVSVRAGVHGDRALARHRLALPLDAARDRLAPY